MIVKASALDSPKRVSSVRLSEYTTESSDSLSGARASLCTWSIDRTRCNLPFAEGEDANRIRGQGPVFGHSPGSIGDRPVTPRTLRLAFKDMDEAKW